MPLGATEWAGRVGIVRGRGAMACEIGVAVKEEGVGEEDGVAGVS